jgi:hypothetical protein
VGASVSKFFVPDYSRRHTSECTQIPPEPNKDQCCEFSVHNKWPSSWKPCYAITVSATYVLLSAPALSLAAKQVQRAAYVRWL